MEQNYVPAPFCGDADLSGQVAVITGGGGGIGSSIAKLFQEKGAKVYRLDYGPAAKMPEILSCDVTDPADVTRVINEIVDREKKIDILITCAGLTSTTPIDEISVDEWDNMFAVNTKGTWLITQAVYQVMKANRYGKMVHISSQAGRCAGTTSGVHYAASKAAVMAISRCVAKLGAPYGVYSNCILPGPTKTRMMDIINAANAHATDAENFPLKRRGEPEDQAYAALFLASQMSNFITGAWMDVNGGMYMG